MDFYLGMVCLFAQNNSHFTPTGWLKCDGRLLPVNQYQALFALLGSEFGGDGRTTFGIPKMSPVKTENGGTLEYYIVAEGGLFPVNDNN